VIAARSIMEAQEGRLWVMPNAVSPEVVAV
jgi:hypothetical protein